LPSNAKLIDGTAIGREMRAELAGEIGALKTRGVTPGLAVVLVGDNPASQVYVRMKGKACDEAGLYHETIKLRKETTEGELLGVLERLNADHRIHGMLVQLPLPPQIDERRVLCRIDPEQYAPLGDRRGQRQLHQHAVDPVVGVETLENAQQ